MLSSKQRVLNELSAAVARLAHYAASRGARQIEELWLDQIRRYEPEAMPDAFYIEPARENEQTLLYDMRRHRFHTVIWTEWRNAREEEMDDFDSLYE